MFCKVIDSKIKKGMEQKINQLEVEKFNRIVSS